MARRPAMTIESLTALGADRLAGLAFGEASRNGPFKKLLAAALAGTKGPDAVAALIDRRLSALDKARGFIDWKKRKAFAADLGATLSTVVDELGRLDPASAVDRLLRFLAGAAMVLGRVDDASGAVYAIYRDAARALPGLVERLSEDEGFRVIGRLVEDLARDAEGLVALALDGCIHLVPVSWLKRVDDGLAAALTSSGRGAAGPGGGDRDAHARRIIEARKALADRHGDVDAFMALEALRPPGSQDTLAIAERLLAAGRFPEALAWVRRPVRRGLSYSGAEDVADGMIRTPSDTARVGLEIRILDAAGEREAAQSLRWTAFEDHLDPKMLREIIAHEPDFGEFAASDRAFDHAMAHPRRHAALTLLLDWPRPDLAARLVIDGRSDWDGRHYQVLAPAAEMLEDDHPAAATLLYRALLDDILACGRSQAYGHAARHLAALDRIAARSDGTAPEQDHAAYRAGLQRSHGRKYGFWSLVKNA